MARIAGVNIPTDKRVEVSLTYIYGVGRAMARKICEKSGVAKERRVHELTEDEIIKIRETIDQSYKVEGSKRTEQTMDIKRLKDLGCYRGLRHRKNLPVRGQRTHTNARSRKGRGRAIAAKKIAV